MIWTTHAQRMALVGLGGVAGGCVGPAPFIDPTEGSTGPSTTAGTATEADDSLGSTGRPDTTAEDTAPVDTPPVATADEYCVQQGAGPYASPVGVLANDADAEGAVSLLTTGIVRTGFGGTVTLAADGTFTYEPPPGFSGDDGFAYTIEDDRGAMAGGTVVLHVAPLRVELSAVAAGEGGFAMTGDAPMGSRAGYVVAGAGDVNGDGLRDLLVGAHRGTAGGAALAGQAFVVWGKAGGEPVDLTALARGSDPSGFAIHGGAATTFAGFDVAAAGDVDGDGRDDVLVGAPWAGDNGSRLGRAYLVWGRTDSSVVELGPIDAGDPALGIAIEGSALLDTLGSGVAGGRDVDGDGRPDVVVAVPALDSAAAIGTVHLLQGFPLDTTPTVAAGVATRSFVGEPAEGLGVPVRLLDDLDLDGIPELGMSAAYGPGQPAGRLYLLLSSLGLGSYDAADLEAGVGGWALDGTDDGDALGRGLDDAGDFDGDGVPDLVVGAPGRGLGAAQGGVAYVIFGGALSIAPTLEDLEAGLGGVVIVGDDGPITSAGWSVAGAGDVNGDGRDDLVVGSPSVVGAEDLECLASRAYVVYGRDEPGPILLSSVARGEGGLAIVPELDYDCAGWSVAGAGDVDDDGLADVLVGAPRWEAGGVAGRAYLVRGYQPAHPPECPAP